MAKSPKKSKNNPRQEPRRKNPADTKKSAAPDAKSHESNGMRETIESIVIAFVLAFLFRTFEAEAFVIPTGSMAHTLRGAHKDVECPQCGYRYQISASSETQENRGGAPTRNEDVVSGTCPICRFTMVTDPRPDPADLLDPDYQSQYRLGVRQPTYNGDRIIVSKFDYVFQNPRRWDVIVFKFPGGANTNYIKRLIGLPGETVGIRNGDVYIGQDGGQLEIESKPPDKALVMRQLVSDNHLQPKPLSDAGWPYRWRVLNAGQGEAADGSGSEGSGWSVGADESEKNRWQVFSSDGSSQEPVWIRYQNILPTFGDWAHVLEGGSLNASERAALRPTLITDTYGYNTNVARAASNRRDSIAPGLPQMGLHWVGDLAVECDVAIESDRGRLLVDLVEAGTHFQARLDVATGQVTLSAGEDKQYAPQGQTAIRGPGEHTINFANVDDRLLLWVDGELIEFDKETKYDARRVFGENLAENGNLVPQSNGEDGDLSPAGVGSQGARLQVTGLRVYRDVYYIADSDSRPRKLNLDVGQAVINEYFDYDAPWKGREPKSVLEFLSSPTRWGAFAGRNQETFPPLEADQFFVMGDNSPESSDCRLWTSRTGGEHFVRRRMLIGKALFIYWPHSWGQWPVLHMLPGWPAFGDMKLVR